jgi:hypothetical protein
MTSESRTLANRLNALASTGPRTDEGKARVAQNATGLGLFSSRDIVRPEETEEYEALRTALESELLPATVMERTLALEILHATWRLRRCAAVENSLTSELDPMEDEQAGLTQTAVDRARAHARNHLRRASADLSRLQTERHLKAQLESHTPEALVSQQAIAKTLAQDTRRRLNLRKLQELDTFESILERAAKFSSSITKQTQPEASKTADS